MESTRLHLEVASFGMHLPMMQKLVLMWQYSKGKQEARRGKAATVNYVDEVSLFCYPFFFYRMSILVIGVGFN